MEESRNNEVFLIENVGPCGLVMISPRQSWFLLKECTVGSQVDGLPLSPCVWEQRSRRPPSCWCLCLPPCCTSPPSFSGDPQPASKSGCTGQSAACPRRSQAVSGPWWSAERVRGERSACETENFPDKMRGWVREWRNWVTFSGRISWDPIIHRISPAKLPLGHSRSFLSLAWLTHTLHLVKPDNS